MTFLPPEKIKNLSKDYKLGTVNDATFMPLKVYNYVINLNAKIGICVPLPLASMKM